MNSRLKQIIFDKLYQDLKHVEIIPYEKSIWFIDRKEKYWYLEYEKSGELWWRWLFFSNFFELFSMEMNEYETIISEWVEEVLNCKVSTPIWRSFKNGTQVEEVLNCKVSTPSMYIRIGSTGVEEVLNCKVNTSNPITIWPAKSVEEVLNCKVETSKMCTLDIGLEVEEILNHKNN